jgi:hypothetical protein
MADIFISYSQADREQVVKLGAYLESEGWTVWFDKNLNPGEPYRDEIMKQLAQARAVIVLWTPNSIKSDFVRAEAGRAKADGKLIPVKTSDVAYGDIPLPFGEMHTEDSSKLELIRLAVVTQLAKPAVQPNALWLATKTVRFVFSSDSTRFPSSPRASENGSSRPLNGSSSTHNSDRPAAKEEAQPSSGGWIGPQLGANSEERVNDEKDRAVREWHVAKRIIGCGKAGNRDRPRTCRWPASR